MKTAKDPRHIERVKTMQELFAWEFSSGSDEGLEVGSVPPEASLAEGGRLDKTEHIIQNLEKIDPEIIEAAPERGLEMINKIDLAVLRQSIYELLIAKNVPVKVCVDEAIEIGKEYGTDSSASFINGALGKVIQKYKLA